VLTPHNTFCWIWVLLELFRTTLMYCTRPPSECRPLHGAVRCAGIPYVLGFSASVRELAPFDGSARARMCQCSSHKERQDDGDSYLFNQKYTSPLPVSPKFISAVRTLSNCASLSQPLA
jgi:hypothetical protein